METEEEPVRLSLHGIPFSGSLDPSAPVAYQLDVDGVWRPTSGDDLSQIDAKCVAIQDALESRMFPDRSLLWGYMRTITPELYLAGLNSESAIGLSDFRTLLASGKECADLFRLLYLFDCQKLVSGIQECAKEAAYLAGEFYRMLNLEISLPEDLRRDGVTFVLSPKTTLIHCVLAMIYVRLHSLLDYTTKLIVEARRTPADFRTYPKMASAKVLYNRTKVSQDNAAGTLFEACETIGEVELVRNFIVHNGLLDDQPKVYVECRHGAVVNKFILMPDKNGYQWARHGNRCLFYGTEDRINLRLVGLLADFQRRQIATLDMIMRELRPVEVQVVEHLQAAAPGDDASAEGERSVAAGGGKQREEADGVPRAPPESAEAGAAPGARDPGRAEVGAAPQRRRGADVDADPRAPQGAKEEGVSVVVVEDEPSDAGDDE